MGDAATTPDYGLAPVSRMPSEPDQSPDDREDLAGDVHRLLTFVEARRAQLIAAGEPTSNADAVLAKLRQGVTEAQQGSAVLRREWGVAVLFRRRPRS